MNQQALSDITAVVLAGGQGTRLQSVVADKPKALAEIYGRPFLTYMFDQLQGFRINHVVLCTGYLGNRIKERFGSSYKLLSIDYSHESQPLGTAGALKNAISYLSDEQILVLNGDSFCGADIAAFWGWHLSKKASASLLLTTLDDTGRYGRVDTDSDGKIIRFSEKGSNPGPGLINAGIYILCKQFIFSIPSGKSVSLEREMFPQWIGKGLYGYGSEGRFIDIGTPEDYSKAGRFFMKEQGNDHK
jgi:NDP-sugar pyrophosphorylase family protein